MISRELLVKNGVKFNPAFFGGEGFAFRFRPINMQKELRSDRETFTTIEWVTQKVEHQNSDFHRLRVV